MLTARREAVLKAIVGDYIDTATPIGSKAIVEKQGLGVSSATVRMEMACLEEEGFILRPHTSAGAIPSDLGYRHYVEHLTNTIELAAVEKQIIHRPLDNSRLGLEEWVHLTAAFLSQITGNLALVTPPKAPRARVKRLELVPIQELYILLILVLQEAKIIRQLLSVQEPVSQGDLTTISNKLSDIFQMSTSSEIEAYDKDLTPLEQHLMEVVKDSLKKEEFNSYEEPLFDGLHQLLEQPEFSDPMLLRDFMDVLEERGLLREIIESTYSGPDVQVAIGSELKESIMHHFSLVIAEYGSEGQVRGVIGILGPKRMYYDKNISVTDYLTRMTNQIMEEIYS